MIIQRHWQASKQVNAVLIELRGDFDGPIPTPAANVAANRRHGPTSTGRRSDHQGPRRFVWAADVPALSLLEGDRLAHDIAHHLGLRDWNGQGVHTEVRQGVRYQVIWRAPGHFDHVHFGVRVPGRLPPVKPEFQ